MITLTDVQKDQLRTWLREGLQLAEIQNRLMQELGAPITYMELKLLVSDLNLVPKDKEPTAGTATIGGPVQPPAPGRTAPPAAPTGKGAPPPASQPGSKGQVTITVDELARPGALVSGGVTFSDGKPAKWLVDEMGRLSVAPSEPGYRPPPADMQEFQTALERELARAGF